MTLMEVTGLVVRPVTDNFVPFTPERVSAIRLARERSLATPPEQRTKKKRTASKRPSKATILTPAQQEMFNKLDEPTRKLLMKKMNIQ
jgi:hypothetical protein